MITTTWISNFGNNMFQWAVLYGVSKKTGLPYATGNWTGASNHSGPVANGKEVFNLPPEPDFSQYRERYIFQDSSSLDQRFNSNIYKIPDGTRLYGYFQSDRYFIDYREDILNAFTFKDPKYASKAKELKEQMGRKVVVCAHSREGDYGPATGSTQVTEIYFKGAIKFLMDKLNLKEEDLGCILISDNKHTQKLNFLNDTGIKLFISQEDNHTDLSIMMHADHCITANSSFSWWGAWLNRNNPLIISPKNWLNFDWADKDFFSPLSMEKMSIPQYFIDRNGIPQNQ